MTILESTSQALQKDLAAFDKAFPRLSDGTDFIDQLAMFFAPKSELSADIRERLGDGESPHAFTDMDTLFAVLDEPLSRNARAPMKYQDMLELRNKVDDLARIYRAEAKKQGLAVDDMSVADIRTTIRGLLKTTAYKTHSIREGMRNPVYHGPEYMSQERWGEVIAVLDEHKGLKPADDHLRAMPKDWNPNLAPPLYVHHDKTLLTSPVHTSPFTRPMAAQSAPAMSAADVPIDSGDLTVFQAMELLRHRGDLSKAPEFAAFLTEFKEPVAKMLFGVPHIKAQAKIGLGDAAQRRIEEGRKAGFGDDVVMKDPHTKMFPPGVVEYKSPAGGLSLPIDKIRFDGDQPVQAPLKEARSEFAAAGISIA